MRWQDPPKGSPWERSAEIDAIVKELQTRPGVWALVAVGSEGAYRTWSAHGCLVQTRKSATHPNKRDIYAQWPADSDGGAS